MVKKVLLSTAVVSSLRAKRQDQTASGRTGQFIKEDEILRGSFLFIQNLLKLFQINLEISAGMIKVFMVILAVAFLASACNIKQAKETKGMARRVEFQTQDSVNIVADYYPPRLDRESGEAGEAPGSTRGAVLVHMMPATRSSWAEFASKLQTAGFHALAIDLRGHGESGGANYQDFNDERHQAAIKDLAAAAEFLKQKGVKELSFAGASIGANLTLQYLAENPEVKAAILLSPGVDYRGIAIEPLAAKASDKSKILFAGAEDDAGTMGAGCEELAGRLEAGSKICYQQGGHGTNLFQSHPDLMDKILEFLKRK